MSSLVRNEDYLTSINRVINTVDTRTPLPPTGDLSPLGVTRRPSNQTVSIPTIEDLKGSALDYVFEGVDYRELQGQSPPTPSNAVVSKSNINQVLGALQGQIPLSGSVADYPIVSKWGTQQQQAYEASLNPEIEALKKQIADLTSKVGVGNEENNPDIGLLKGQIAFYESLLKEYKGDTSKATVEYEKYKSDTALIRDVLLGLVGFAGGEAIAPILGGISWGYTAPYRAANYAAKAKYTQYGNVASFYNKYPLYTSNYIRNISRTNTLAYQWKQGVAGVRRGWDTVRRKYYYYKVKSGYTKVGDTITKKKPTNLKGYVTKGSKAIWTAYAVQQLGRSAYNTANAYTGFNQGAYMDSRGATYKRQYWSWKYQKWLPSKY